MKLKHFLRFGEVIRSDSPKVPRFGLLYFYNEPETKAIILFNNRDAVFTDVKIEFIDENDISYTKVIDRIDSRVSVKVSFHEILNSDELPFQGIFKCVYIESGKKRFKFEPRADKFVFKGYD